MKSLTLDMPQKQILAMIEHIFRGKCVEKSVSKYEFAKMFIFYFIALAKFYS
jgi:hypothetical protein